MRGAASQRNKSVIRGRLVTAAASQTVARSNCRIRRPLTILSAVRPRLANGRGAFDIWDCLFPSAAAVIKTGLCCVTSLCKIWGSLNRGFEREKNVKENLRCSLIKKKKKKS